MCRDVPPQKWHGYPDYSRSRRLNRIRITGITKLECYPRIFGRKMLPNGKVRCASAEIATCNPPSRIPISYRSSSRLANDLPGRRSAVDSSAKIVSADINLKREVVHRGAPDWKCFPGADVDTLAECSSSPGSVVDITWMSKDSPWHLARRREKHFGAFTFRCRNFFQFLWKSFEFHRKS